jgi:hypothetical protein
MFETLPVKLIGMSPKGKREPAVAATNKLPAWIPDHFEQSLNSIQTLIRIVNVSERGISVLRAMPRAIKAIAKAKDTEDTPDTARQIESAEKEAALAQQEVEKNFPVLHGLAVVALWSWLENFVKEFVVLWLLHRKDAYSVAALQKLKVRLGEYLQLSKTEQAHYVVELLEQDLAGCAPSRAFREVACRSAEDTSSASPVRTLRRKRFRNKNALDSDVKIDS